MQKTPLLLFLCCILLFPYSCKDNEKKQEQKPVVKLVPKSVKFKKETLKRIGSRGDNWCLTWAKDGSQIVSMDDGNWLVFEPPIAQIHNDLYRVIGGPDNFQREEISNYPDFRGEDGSWFGYGIVSVNGDLYSAISKTPGPSWSGPFTGIKLLKSSDNAESWHRVNREGKILALSADREIRNVVNEEEMFFLEEFGIPHKEQIAYPFSFIDFVQEGQNHSASKDNFVYIYSPEGAQAHKLTLAKTHKDSIDFRDAWEYFTAFDGKGEPQWSKHITERGYVHEFPQKSAKGHHFGWYSWLPSVVWNEGLELYIMVNGGSYGGYGMTDSDVDYYDRWMHTETGSLGFWYSENPYGPWTEFFYTDYWTVDDDKNRTYQPKLSPKWISEDGKKMTLIWSDAMKNAEGKSHSTNYLWNQMEIEITVE